MSKYTTEVRFICENALGLEEQGDYSDIAQAIQAGRGRIFTFNYPIFDENYRGVIETEFLRHFYTREIGFETVALFRLKLEDTWTLRIPKYNKLWESALLDFDPLRDTDYYKDHKGHDVSDKRDNAYSTSQENVKDKGEITTHGEGESHNDNHNLNKYSDTPQGALNGIINTDWLTNATQDDGTANERYENDNKTEKENETTSNGVRTNDSSSNIVNADEYLDHIYGKMNGETLSLILTKCS